MSQGDDATLPDPRLQGGSSGRMTAADLGDRYEVGAVIGRGGMGEVRLARDVRIHRDVAVKLMRSTQRDDATVGRFFREARVQGVLDHPAVVPVHDLGIDHAGNPYFVMKRLAGITVADVLVSDDAALKTRWPRRQLLARFVDICLAVEFAHQRGVIHRDIKPANIMLGDFGEAYLLDWGLARVADDSVEIRNVLPLSGEDVGHTAAGDMLGTPGYMSPEQARGDTVDTRTDVFALGCVLFEILAGKPALPRGMQGIAATLATDRHRPSRVAAEIPPELDDLCAHATEEVPERRPSARELADKSQAYLDGDRDLERRRELAETHAQTARAALREPGDEARATAMREAGRAIALDPTNATAQEVLGAILVEAPTDMPAGARAEADLDRARSRRAALRWATHGYVGLILGGCLLLYMSTRQRPAIIGMLAISLLAWTISHRLSRDLVSARSPLFVVLLLLSSAQLVMAAIMLGPLMMVPVFLVGGIAAFLSQPTGYPPWLVVVGFVAPYAVVLALELVGVINTLQFAGGSLILTAPAIDLTPVTTALIVVGSIGTQLLHTIFVASSTMKSQRAAQDAIHAQRWHLRQMVPTVTDTAPVPKIDPPQG